MCPLTMSRPRLLSKVSGIIVIADGPPAEWGIATFLIPHLTAINCHVGRHEVRLAWWQKKIEIKMGHMEYTYIFIFGHFLVKMNDATQQQCNLPDDCGLDMTKYILRKLNSWSPTTAKFITLLWYENQTQFFSICLLLLPLLFSVVYRE